MILYIDLTRCSGLYIKKEKSTSLLDLLFLNKINHHEQNTTTNETNKSDLVLKERLHNTDQQLYSNSIFKKSRNRLHKNVYLNKSLKQNKR